MEQARAVLERLERIESLRRVDAPAGTLLGEVRALLTEAEAWVEAERPGPAAENALERSRQAMVAGKHRESGLVPAR